ASALPSITSGSLAAGDSANFTESYAAANAGSNLTLTPSGSVSDGNGGHDYAVSFVTAQTGVITRAATPLALSPSGNTSTLGQAVTFTAVVSNASGTGATPAGGVHFYDGATDLGAGVQAGGSPTWTLATAGLTGGSHSITAAFSGNGNFTGSVSR